MRNNYIVTTLFYVSIYLLLTSDVNITPISHFAQAQHYGYNAISISDTIVVCKSKTGIDIYSILPDNNISLISYVDIANPISFKVVNNYIYVSSVSKNHEQRILSQIDITNISMPFINQNLTFNYSDRLSSFEIFNTNLLFMYEKCTQESILIHTYDLPDLEYSGTISGIDVLRSLNDNIGYSFGDAPNYNPIFWDVSDPSQIEMILEVNMSQYHSSEYIPFKFTIFNDSLLAASGQTSVSFWKISDFGEWEYLNQMNYPDGNNENETCPIWISCNKMFVSDNYGLAMYSIEDLNNILLLDFIECEGAYLGLNTISFILKDSFLFVTSLLDGIDRYYHDETSISYLDKYLETPTFYFTIIHETFLIACSYYYGIYFYDLNDPENPAVISGNLPYSNLIHVYYYNTKIAVTYILNGNYYFDLYDASDFYNISFVSQYSLEYGDIVKSANEDWNELYIHNISPSNMHFKKVSLDQTGNLETIFSYNLPSLVFHIYDEKGYFLESINGSTYLKIVSGLNQNNPEIVNSIEIGNYNINYLFFKPKNNLLEFNSFVDETIFFYEMENPEQPQFLTQLSEPTFSSGGVVLDNHYFSVNSKISYIYDLNNPLVVVCPIGYVFAYTNIIMINHMTINNAKYLLVDNQGSLEIWEVEIYLGTDKNIIHNSTIKISNYPNPFNPSTTISFSLTTEVMERMELVIYNIKGQKVKTLMDCAVSPGTYNCIWHGRDDAGKRVASGEYIAVLKVNDKILAERKMLLIK